MRCSSPPPPKMTPTFNLLMLALPGEVQAVGQRVLDHVAQCVVGVVSGVRSDEHVRQLLQLEQQPALYGFASAVGVEDSFLAFDDVQRRAAQPAAFQRYDEALGIEKWAAPGVDDERAVLHLLDVGTVEQVVGIS